MARQATVKHIRKAGAFSDGELAAGETGFDTSTGVLYVSFDGSTVRPLFRLPYDVPLLARNVANDGDVALMRLNAASGADTFEIGVGGWINGDLWVEGSFGAYTVYGDELQAGQGRVVQGNVGADHFIVLAGGNSVDAPDNFGGNVYAYGPNHATQAGQVVIKSSGSDVVATFKPSGEIEADGTIAGDIVATQAEAEAGSVNNHLMTPLRVTQQMAVLQATIPGVVTHGATAATARPSGYAVIHWYGSVEPENAATNDLWFDTSA